MPNADTYRYDEWEISDWDEDKTQYAINELFARHGHDFDQDNQNEDVREYEEWLEENTTWYNKIDGKTVEPKEDFNDTEYDNFILLTDHRKALSE